MDPFRERLVDDVIERYVCWREACAGVDSAYAAWHAARRGERRLAGAAYIAALDREQHAALVYSQTVQRVAAFPERVAA
jgi:hypothetical protein